MTSKYVVPNNYRLHLANQFLESLSEANNSVYYLFAAKHVPFSNNTIPQPYDTNKSLTVDIYQDMMYGKKVSNTDVCLMIDRYNWESNSVFYMYDDTDISLPERPFYTVVNASSYYHVWKCLDNNANGYSTVEPNFADIDAQDEVYETSDKYRWKYMYSITAADMAKFATVEYMPLKANSVVSENSIDGTIDIIKVEISGAGYDNHTTGIFSNTDIKLNGNSLVYAINSQASSVNSFYNDCILYISTGTGAGQYRTIENYYVNNSVKFVVLDEAFDTVPTNSSEYQISPKVEITGVGNEIELATARAIINSSGNSVSRIEMMNRGSGYSYISARVLSSNVVSITTNAEVRAIYSPYGGHGYSAEKELYAKRIAISVKLANNESNTIPSNNDINQIGLLKDPIFSNVVIETTQANGSFTGGELVYKIEPILINIGANVSLTTANIISTSSDFLNQLNVGDFVYLKGNNQHQLAVVNTITNATHMSITTNGFFACSSANIYLPRVSSYGTATGIALGELVLDNVNGVFENNNSLIGLSSGAYAIINTISRSDKVKGFDTFVQMYQYRVQGVSGAFIENEQVYQDTLGTSNAYLHSVEDLGSGFYKLFVSNQIGIFNTLGSINGANSGAIATILEAYNPEVVYNSGEILYLENVDTITREADQSETFKLIFEF